MRKDEERILLDTEVVKQFERQMKSTFGPKNVTVSAKDNNIVFTISNGNKTITRKGHTFPEHRRKDGD